MHSVITPSRVGGTISAPPSKSYSHRAILMAALAEGTSSIRNTLLSDDILHTLACCKALGTKIHISSNTVTITGVDGHPTAPSRQRPLTCGASGTTARLIAAVASLCHDWVLIDGEGRLRQRPMKTLIDALTSQGVSVEYGGESGLLPIRVKSDGIQGGHISVHAGTSSQFVSALLIIAPYAVQDTIITALSGRSTPYIEITRDMMKTFGVITTKTNEGYHISCGQKYTARSYTVEGDYSSASYVFASAAVTGSTIYVKGLNPKSAQGDRMIVDILKQMGCDIEVSPAHISIHGRPLRGITIDMGDYPDIVPTLCAIAPYASSPTTIKNISHLRQKETDRIHAVCKELSKMDVLISSTEDTITILPSSVKGAALDTYDDHRMAMSFSIAALSAKGESIIKDANVVSKSYPDFWDDMKSIGMNYRILT